MSDLGFRQASGTIDNSGLNPYGNGFFSATFTPQIFATAANVFEIYHISLKGPVGSTLEVWVNSAFWETTPRGDINSYDPKNALRMMGGQSLIFYWNSAGAIVSGINAPLVTVWMREPLFG